MRYFFILNPGSGGGKSRHKLKRIFDILDRKNINYEYKLTSSLEDAYILSLQANQKGYDVIVAVGGDGTINRVLNGFYNACGSRISSAKFAVIHTGTSPDFCKSYNIPLKIDRAVNMLLTGNSKRIQIGKVTHTCLENQNIKTSYFACCANIGLGASLARNANSGIRKYMGDYAGTFLALIKTLLNYKTCKLTVSFDGQKQFMERVYNIAVGRSTYIASGIKVKNNLSSGDSRFYTLIVKNMRFTNWPRVIGKVYSGKEFVNNDIISLQYAKVIEVCGSGKHPELEFDGDPAGYLPCLIEVAQDPLDLICEV
ncbi:MAG: diacylglycerol kinase [Firmicutes bacterium]|nr:diacylglycerol kinase [Bacillota bacterium]